MTFAFPTAAAQRTYRRALWRHPGRRLRALRASRIDPARWLGNEPVVGASDDLTVDVPLLFTTDEGLFLRDPARGTMRILEGHCYGLTRIDDTWIVGRADRTDFDRHREMRDLRARNTQLLALRCTASGVTDLRVAARGIPGEVHQIAVLGGRLWFPLVFTPLVLSLGVDALLGPGIPRPAAAFEAEAIALERVTHVNSITVDAVDGALWLVAHNDSTHTGRPSELLRRAAGEPSWSRVALDGRCAHDVSVVGGRWIALDSLGGRVLSDARELCRIDGFLRGLEIHGERLLVGCTTREPVRRARHDATSSIVEIDAAGREYGRATFPRVGPINQIAALEPHGRSVAGRSDR